MGTSFDLAQAICNSRWDDVPPDVRHAGKRSLLNYFATALAGSADQAVHILVPFLSKYSSAADTIVIGRPERLDMPNAAAVNAASANVFDFDDTHHPTIIHPTAPVAPAVFALAEHRPATGVELLHAFIIGVEVACRIGNAVSPGHYSRGWHITSTCGIFGAAAAAGKLLQLDVRRLVWAFGSAAAQSSGLVETLGTMAKSIGVANAARNGLMSALLAREGIAGPEQPLEGPRGFLRVLAERANEAAIMDRWGSDWESLRNVHKPYPCGIVLNPVIDACFELRRREGFRAADIVSVTVRGNPLLRQRADRPSVATGREAQVSAQHGVAVAIAYGAAGLPEFSDACVQRPEISALRSKVRIVEAADVPVESATVAITMAGGRELSATVSHARGTLQRPMSDREIEDKLRTLAALAAPGFEPSPLIEAVWGLEEARDAAALMRLVSPGGRIASTCTPTSAH